MAFAGTFLAATMWKRWLVLPGLVGAFLFQHALQGWCPPVPVLRRLGYRTAREIETERVALKALRGDSAGSILRTGNGTPARAMRCRPRDSKTKPRALVPGSSSRPTAFIGMVRFTQWLVGKGVPKTAGAAAERLSTRLSVIAVLGTCAAALFQPSVPTPTASHVPVEILRTKQAPLILRDHPAERPTN